MVFKTDYGLMQFKSIGECSKEHSAVRSTFIELPFVFKTFVLSILNFLSGRLEQVLLYLLYQYV